MGWFSNAVATVFPQQALKRATAKVELEAAHQALRLMQGDVDGLSRHYDAGKLDRVNSGWRDVFSLSGVQTDSAYRDIVRNRARDLERNSDTLNGMLAAIVRNVVKDGINLQAKTADAELNDLIETLWAEWKKPENCDVAGAMEFSEMMRCAVRRKYVDGGVLFLKTYGGGAVPFQLQMLEVDELADGQAVPKHKGNTVVGGIETNATRKAVGYWIRQYSPDGTQELDPRYVEAKQVIPYLHKTRPSQIREMSPLANMLSRIRDIDSYMEAVSMKERIASCMALIVTESSTGDRGRGAKQSKDKASGYLGTSITPGMIRRVAPGESVTPVIPPAQGSSAADMVRLQQRLAAGGAGLSYETASRDMSQVNYSSARQGLIEDESTYAIEQQLLLSHVLNDVYSEFITSAMLGGLLNIPNFWDKKQEWMQHTWIMPGRKWIDPVKQANANKIAMATGQQTLAQIVGEQGRDWKEHIDEIAAINEYAKEKGVDLVGEAKQKAAKPDA